LNKQKFDISLIAVVVFHYYTKIELITILSLLIYKISNILMNNNLYLPNLEICMIEEYHTELQVFFGVEVYKLSPDRIYHSYYMRMKNKI
jgi:hypothetical protein